MRVTTIGKLLGCISLVAFCAANANASLIITGIFDGPLDGGEPKVVELYACEDIDDLSTYAVGAANNLGGTDGVESFLPAGPVSKGTFVYIIDDNSDSALGVEFNDYFGFTPSILVDSNAGSSGGAAALNGDDAVELFFDATGAFSGGQTVVDVFGEISGPVTGWSYVDGWAYRNSMTGPDGSTFVAANWTFSGDNATDGQTTNGQVGGSFFPIGTYTCVPEPASVAMVALATLAMLGVSRRRA